MSGPAVYARPDLPMNLRGAVDVLLHRREWLADRLAELDPDRGGAWHYVTAELRAIDTAVPILLHEASLRAEEAPRRMSAYGIGRVPMAAT